MRGWWRRPRTVLSFTWRAYRSGPCGRAADAGGSRAEGLVGQRASAQFERAYLKAVAGAVCGEPSVAEATGVVRERLHGLGGLWCDVDVWAPRFLEQDRPMAHLVLHEAHGQIEHVRRQDERFDARHHASARWNHAFSRAVLRTGSTTVCRWCSASAKRTRSRSFRRHRVTIWSRSTRPRSPP